jgi:hypothetical protein
LRREVEVRSLLDGVREFVDVGDSLVEGQSLDIDRDVSNRLVKLAVEGAILAPASLGLRAHPPQPLDEAPRALDSRLAPGRSRSAGCPKA